ncbi:hypothetical protein [Calothrix sp. 336/3]|uniref:hypothetical protein n=1 Tax=Calothrix sp. 336/3 TaxID=1337936 RepID=UPI0004E34EC2|nr:hypothetical protein [Calothrix sp. 336/3]AKG20765.1 hypothetical protein IJ00_05060 [Calothrix sp. 336/3]
MLKALQVTNSPSSEHMLHLWVQRYRVDFAPLARQEDASYLLLQAASVEGRSLTVNKFQDSVLNIICQMAWIQTGKLYNYISNIIDLQEARRITHFTFRIYKKLLDCYQKQALNSHKTDNGINWGITAIADLAYALEPILIVFQEQHLVSKDWRCLGFMTTQLNFTNQLIISKLSPVEAVLLKPYLDFVEEQVAIPWQRVCSAASQYEVMTPKLRLAQEIMSHASANALVIYQQLVQLLPHHQSRRGYLTNPDIYHSCLRDLNMFQAYICLCLLEGSLKPIQEELVPLCTMVMESLEIKWEMIEIWCQLLAQELQRKVSSEYLDLLQPYTQGMWQLFFQQRSRLGY